MDEHSTGLKGEKQEKQPPELSFFSLSHILIPFDSTRFSNLKVSSYFEKIST